MSVVVEFQPGAEDDIAAAIAWYSSERVELASAFLDQIESTIGRLAHSPTQFPEVARGFRRALLTRFPYGVFFRFEHSRVVILAVLHLHRHPDTWMKHND